MGLAFGCASLGSVGLVWFGLGWIGLGWIGFDPTNNCLAREDHILIGMGRDYADVSPIDGTFIGNAPQKMASAVDVTLLEEEALSPS